MPEQVPTNTFVSLLPKDLPMPISTDFDSPIAPSTVTDREKALNPKCLAIQPAALSIALKTAPVGDNISLSALTTSDFFPFLILGSCAFIFFHVSFLSFAKAPAAFLADFLHFTIT